MPLAPFPSVPCGEFTIARPFTAPGLFFYRHMQAANLLRFPDCAKSDLSTEQRRSALLQHVSAHRPLAALVLFLGVVALEDFIRDLGVRLAEVNGLEKYFPKLIDLRLERVRPKHRYSQVVKDPAIFSDWTDVNKLYARVIGVTPLQQVDLPKLHDLAIIRHTVAHHAALIRPVDIDRFQYWSMHPNSLINPPVEFVQNISHFLYQTGRGFEKSVASQIFASVIQYENADWFENPSELILALIETFNWFGNLLTEEGDEPTPVFGELNYEKVIKAVDAANKTRLTLLCLQELKLRHSA